MLVYHNISPWEGFMPFDPELANLLRSGRDQLTRLRDRVVLAVADSAFNAEELEALGFPHVPVSPLILDLDGLSAGQPDPTTEHDLASIDGPLVLFVGQLLPHKRPDLLVAAHHVLSTYLRPEVNLALVGAFRLPGYAAAVRAFVHQLNLSTVRITGRVTHDQLVAYYRRADLFMTASEHEGFCVPLLEAMAFDVPVVATPSAAIPETLAGAGLLVPDDRPDGLRRGRARLARRRAVSGASSWRAVASAWPAYDVEQARQTFLSHLLEVARRCGCCSSCSATGAMSPAAPSCAAGSSRRGWRRGAMTCTRSRAARAVTSTGRTSTRRAPRTSKVSPCTGSRSTRPAPIGSSGR